MKRKKLHFVNCAPWGFHPANKGNHKGCGRRFAVENLEYIQTLYWVYPYSCTEGGYFGNGEGQFVCPRCGAYNRLCERPDVTKLKPFFKATREHYDRQT